MVESVFRSRAFPGLLVLALGAYAFMPICDLHFDCGCKWPGFGGHAHCDIHLGGLPDCPWCDHTWIGYAAFGSSAILVLAALWGLPRTTSWWVATFAGLATFAFGMLAAGIATSWWMGLPLLAGL